MLRRTIALGLLLFAQTMAGAEDDSPHFGLPASKQDIAAHNSVVFPDGAGLPTGRGTVTEGEALFAARCVACHGFRGRGGTGGELAGGDPDLTRELPDKTIGTYWPHATTVFDFIRRAMPMNAPGSLSDAEVYAVTAYLLFENGIIEQSAILDADALKAIKMPNRDGFIWIDAVR
jgi:cytochrome c